MDYKIEKTSKSKREIEVTVSPEEMEEYLEKAARKLSSEIEIKGFRPGKAPLNVVKEAVGDERVWHEACHEAINETYPEIVEKESLEVISAPDVEIMKMTVNESLVYKASVSIVPEVELPDYKAKAKKVLSEKKDVKVDPKEVDTAIESIRSSRAKTVKVSREAKNGDEVVITFQGKVDGTAQEGLKGEKMPILLGETRFVEGFEDALLGMKEGEKKNFSVKVPFTEGSEKDVEFDVEVISVNERELPETNDEFATSLGDFSGIDDLRKKIGDNILAEKEGKENERIRVKIIEAISEETSVEVPQPLIERETENMVHEFKEQFARSGGSFEDYLVKSKKTEDQVKEEWKGQAEKRIVASLILQEIAKREKIDADEEELKEQAAAYLDRIGDEKTRKGIDRERLKTYLADIIRNDKVFKMLESL